MPIVNYLLSALIATGWQLGVFLGPALLLGGILHFLSHAVRVRSARLMGPHTYVYLTAPGVVVHELGHVLFCILFRHRILKVRLFRPDADGSLGRVDHSYNPRNAYQAAGNFFIGTGPIWLGSAVIYLLCIGLLGPGAMSGPDSDLRLASGASPTQFGQVIEQSWSSARGVIGSLLNVDLLGRWTFWVFGYVVFCIGSHMTLSPPDIAGAWRGFLWLVGLLLAGNLLTLWSSPAIADELVRAAMYFGSTLYAIGLLVIAINLALLTLIWTIGVVTRRR